MSEWCGQGYKVPMGSHMNLLSVGRREQNQGKFPEIPGFHVLSNGSFTNIMGHK